MPKGMAREGDPIGESGTRFWTKWFPFPIRIANAMRIAGNDNLISINGNRARAFCN